MGSLEKFWQLWRLPVFVYQKISYEKLKSSQKFTKPLQGTFFSKTHIKSFVQFKFKFSWIVQSILSLQVPIREILKKASFYIMY